jgi:serine/threonine-protein kinase
MTGSGDVLSGSRESLAFLQERVARFGLVAGCLFLFALIARVVIALFARQEFEESLALHGLAVVLLFAIWLSTRTGRRSQRDIRAIEFGGLLAASLATTGLGMLIPPTFSPELIITLALALGLLARVAYVPSSARRTLALCIAIGIPLIGTVYWRYSLVDPVWWRKIGGEWSIADTAQGIALGKALNTTLWWIATTVLCTTASRVIFGLRRAVRQAEHLGQYTLEAKLGEGAMGVVYKARHSMLLRPTAVKLLLPDKVGEAYLARFEREVQLTARLTHPHTVTIFDYGRTPDGTFYYAMELLDGAGLDMIVDVTGPQPPERVLYIMDQVAAALSEAHGMGIIHRDIKPGNIILTQQGGEPDVSKVVDFGLVKDMASDPDPAVSQADAVVGTPRYMSPETIVAYHQVDARSDLYSLGAVAYFLLTGEHVFDGESAAEVVTHHIQTKPVPPSKRTEAEIPGDLEGVVMACLQKEPSRRPQSANHLRARLWACASRGKWNTDLARRWWKEHGDTVRARRDVYVDHPGDVGKTIAIDLGRHRR